MAITHKFKKGESLFSTTLSSSIGTGTGETITPASVSGLPTDTEITLTIDRVDTNGTATPAKLERITGTISGGNLTSYTRGTDGTTEQSHASGAVVEYIWNSQDWNDLVDGILVGHNQDGTHDFATLYDTNGNEQIKLTATASAVNEITVTNAATGNAPEISATGGDTNVDLKLKGKGTGHTLVYDQSRAEYHPAIMYRTNFIINGNMDVWQRGTSFTASVNNDDVYTADRWNLISDGNDAVDITREATDKPDGSMYSMKLDTETSARYGVVQFIENIDSKKLDNKNVSLSFAAKTTSSQVTTLRAAVLTWGSTADNVTSDVVGTWAATPTWATNWTQENTPADITITDSWATYTIENIAIDTATVNNVAVVIWTPNAETIGDVWYLSQVQLTEGKDALPFQPKSYAQELADCQRYCIAYGGSGVSTSLASGFNYSTTIAQIVFQFPQTMRANPTLNSTAADWKVAHTNTSTDVSTLVISSNSASPNGVILSATVAAGLTAGQASALIDDGTGNRLLYFEAEL